ncbi:hypothetical protein ACRZ5O_21230 [Pseudomonas protegens]|uniref:hypothetical protein n=1 Tax=Pseudomonas protegens TaxID=380021 RepID=UPI003FD7BCF0
MGPITEELLEALQQAKAEGEEIVKITLYASAWAGLLKEGSGLTGKNGEQRTFNGIPVFPSERDPISPRFVLETK